MNPVKILGLRTSQNVRDLFRARTGPPYPDPQATVILTFKSFFDRLQAVVTGVTPPRFNANLSGSQVQLIHNDQKALRRYVVTFQQDREDLARSVHIG
jgi:hypothetical protein